MCARTGLWEPGAGNRPGSPSLIYTQAGNESILLNPVAGDWTFEGDGDTGIAGGGSDGVADQISIADKYRDNYDNGNVVWVQTFLTNYGDGTDTTATNADELFAGADFHNGFSAVGGDMKIDIIPEPTTLSLLGLAGLAVVRRRRR